MEKKYLTAKEAAALGGFAAGSLANMRHFRRGCRFYKRGKKILYDLAEFEGWLRSSPVLTIDSVRADRRTAIQGNVVGG
jgi:hypothetical protein